MGWRGGDNGTISPEEGQFGTDAGGKIRQFAGMKPRLPGVPSPWHFLRKMARAGRFHLGVLGLAAVAAAPAATLEELVRQPGLWPAEVKLTAATKAVILKDGQPAGTMLLGAGKTLVVANISAEGITGRAGGATVRVPVDRTDLPARVGITPPSGEKEKETVKYATPADAQSRAKLQQSESPATAAVTPVQRLFVGNLVQLQDGALRYYEMRRLNGLKYYGIMFSAGWCGPCRAFAPQLLDHYRRLKESYPEFELIMVSRDNSAGEMADYMREEQMPWPALKYDTSRSLPEIERLAGPGIPCLVLIDAEGRVLAHSFKGEAYPGPASVLDAAWRILKKNHRG